MKLKIRNKFSEFTKIKSRVITQQCLFLRKRVRKEITQKKHTIEF